LASSFDNISNSYAQAQQDKANHRNRELDLRQQEISVTKEKSALEQREFEMREQQMAAAWLESGNSTLITLANRILVKYLN
jgi:hypothetical protein